MIDVVTNGKRDTGMKGFATVLDTQSINDVVDFVRQEFMLQNRVNTRYHTIENGWPNHEQYLLAFPFALGEIKTDVSWENLTPQEKTGKRIFLNSCVSCHDRGTVVDKDIVWELRPLSFPRNDFTLKQPKVNSSIDALSAASPYSVHDVKPIVTKLTESQQFGEKLYQRNCAFCHAADGSGRNWIGSFLTRRPRDLTSAEFMQKMTHQRLKSTIMYGLANTTMPAWKGVLSESEVDAIVDYIDRVFYSLANHEHESVKIESQTPTWNASEK